MPMNDTTEPAVRSARAAFRSAAITFATSTIPPLAATLDAAVLAASGPGDHPHPLFTDTADADFYRNLKRYADRLITAGVYAGPALPLR